jgi:hypothetical protein
MPQIFLVTSIGSGIEKIIEQNTSPPNILDILLTPDIYLPLIAFFILIIITVILKKLFYKNE